MSFLIDTSVWLNYLNGISNRETEFVRSLLTNDRVIFSCPIVIQEVLQGIRDDKEYIALKEWLLSLEVLNSDHLLSGIKSAELYRSLRKKGYTPRNSNDCLIAWYAIHHDLTLVHNDRDFDLIAEHTPLKTYQTG